MPAVRSLIGFVLALPSCTTIGAQRVERDQLDYGEAWGTATQRQMLLNIVKLRYGEGPSFLEVASVINQYSVEGPVGVSAPPGIARRSPAPSSLPFRDGGRIGRRSPTHRSPASASPGAS